MSISEKAKEFLGGKEGLVLFLYDDAIYPTVQWRVGDPISGHITIGRGHVCTPDEIRKYNGKIITVTEAERLFDQDIKEAEDLVDSKRYNFSQTYQRDATILLVFNGGTAPLNGTFGKYLRRGNWSAAAAEMTKWNKVDKVVAGKKVKAFSPGLLSKQTDLMIFFLIGSVIKR